MISIAKNYLRVDGIFARLGFLLAVIVVWRVLCVTNISPEVTRRHKAPLIRVQSDSQRLFPEHDPFRIWTMDMHMATIGDLDDRLTPMGVKFLWKSLSWHCQGEHGCGQDLKVVNKSNGLSLSDDKIKEFQEVYLNDPEIQSADAFVCFHPPAMCQLFIPFNKSIIVIASTRYELGRDQPAERWVKWNDDLIQLAKDPKNIIAANNLYDAQYIQYFTGIPARVLPSYCGSIPHTYSPTKSVFLLFAGRGVKSTFSRIFMKEYNHTCEVEKITCPEIQYIKDAYPNGYQYAELVSHPALIHAPYQVSVMSLFEQYRMNLPMFFPSLSLLTRWEHRHTWIKERILFTTRTNLRPNGSAIPCHPSQNGVPDPNTVEDLFSIQYWLKMADFYQWPYLTYFDSYLDLIEKLNSVDLLEISSKMKIYNEEHRKRLDAEWADILTHLAKFRGNK